MSKINFQQLKIKTFGLILIGLAFVLQANAQVLIWYDDMTNFPTNWTTGGTGGPWTRVSTRYKSSPYSAKCTPNANYSNNQNNWMQRNINLSGYENAAVVFSIWQNTQSNDYIYFEYRQGSNWITHWARAGNYGGFDQQVMANIPNNATAIRFRFASDGSGTAEGVYIDDVYLYGYRYDVGCTQIIAPTDTVDSGQVVTPQGVVYNFGDFISTFNVRMRIGSFYNNAQQVTNLPPGGSQTRTFTNWTALQRGTHLVRCSTEHPNDINRSNDRTIGYVTVRVRNVGTAAIIAPTGTVDSGQVIIPKAEIRNYGTTTETFTVYFWISTGYASSRVLTLASGAAETTSFDPWIALPRGTHTTRCSTALVGDMKPSDNRQTGSVTVRVRDVGVTKILVPTGYIDSTATLIPQAKIQNYGTHQENLSVIFRITGPVTWSTTANVTNLNPGEERLINFAPWTIGPRGNYTTRCSTALVGDQITANNWRDSSFVVRVHDVGVVDISSPPSSVDSNTTVPVTATVRNYGSETENFSVQFRIGNFYTSNRTLTLLPGEWAVVNFDTWQVLQTRNTYFYACSTSLGNDANPNNNIKTGSVTVQVHDVGVAQILSPPSQVDTNTNVPVQALVKNYGTYQETFTVEFRIDNFYSDTSTITIQAGDSSFVNFATWSVTQPRGNYSLRCSTKLSSDANPNNNIQSGSVAIMVHDVGVATFNSPPPEVDTNTTVLVSATVANYGTYNETFNVRYKIGNFYSSVRSVTVAPNSSQLVIFDDWPVLQPRGTYPRQCSTMVSNDVNPNNNQISGLITVNVHDVGVIGFANLPTAVDSGTAVTIQAQVANYGTYSENFTVQCLIAPNYNSVRNITLPAGETTLVTFDLWNALTRNYNLVQCTVQLNDNNPENNYQSESVFVVVRDVAVLAIIVPAETTSQGQGIVPKTQVFNFGNQSVSCPVWFKITKGLTPIYLDTVNINLEPNSQLVVEFAPWRPESLGIYWLETRVVLPGDMHPNNDFLTGSTIVSPYFAWIQKSPLPLGSGKKVKQGGSLVFVPESTVYALKGSNTNEFYRYHIANDSWTQVCSIPSLGAKPKRVKGGACLCYGGGYIYALKGSNTAEFWRYTPQVDSWYEKQPVPAGPKGKKIKGGSGLAFVTKDDTNFIFCLKGSKTDEFYAYWIDADTWLVRKSITLAPSGKPISNGSCMTYDLLTNTIFVLKAKTNEFYAYDVNQDSWRIKTPMPLFGTMNKKKKVKDGAAIVSDGAGLLYAFKGGNTNEFWAYEIEKDTWVTKEPIPLGTNKKRVKAGGSLTIAPGLKRIYAFKGGNTNEFWMYKMAQPQLQIPSPYNAQEGITSSSNQPLKNNRVNIVPNPASKVAMVEYELARPAGLILKLYSACGELVQILSYPANANMGKIKLDISELPVGVYVVKLESPHCKLSKKLVKMR
ncbi:MAG: T9SS type A sorting domain-containing protein [candidate division WOR-3 bacterium]